MTVRADSSAVPSAGRPVLEPNGPAGSEAAAPIGRVGRDASLERSLARWAAAERILEEAKRFMGAEAAPSGIPKRVDNEPGFILQTRPWRESSLLLDVLTARCGRVFLVAKGAKRPGSQIRGLLTAFAPLHFSWTGRAEVKILASADWLGSPPPLAGEALMSGFYLNELVLRLTVREDPSPALFSAYCSALLGLTDEDAAQRSRALRMFERALLAECGWPLAVSGRHLDAALFCVVHQGSLVPIWTPQQAERFSRIERDARAGGGPVPQRYALSAALAAVAGDFSTDEKLRAGRDILREVIQFHLGVRGLKTRRVFSELHALERG